MKQTMVIFLVSILCISYTGCSKLAYFIVYNNTNKSITLHFYAKKDSPLKEPEEAVFIIDSKKAIRISDPWSWYADKLEINIGNDVYIYDCGNVPRPVAGYVGTTCFNRYIFFQFDADGKIYLLKPDNLPTSEIDISDKESKSYTFPSAKIPEQPKGYPLVPVEKYKIINN